MKICMIGLGYIGLPTAAMFAKSGLEVVGVDIMPTIVETLNNGEVPIEEPGLAPLVQEVVGNGRLRASLFPEQADAFIISVPTPNREDEYKSCDLSAVLHATRQLLPYLQSGNTIIIESTIAPRSTEDFIQPLIEEAGWTIGKDIFLVHCPERVLPGQILHELVHNNRIVGGVTPACAEAAEYLYKKFVKGDIIKTNAKTAEMSKLIENTFRDVNIALANELAKLCHELGINVYDVIQMANKHPRVNVHQPGPGVGGHCLAVDPYFIVAKAPETAKMIQLARDINVSMPEYVVDQVKALLHTIDRPKIVVLGITYKANIDDIRESPALEIIEKLKGQGAQVIIYDPHVHKGFYKEQPLEETVEEAHMLLLLTDHDEFKSLNYDQLAMKMKNPLLFDTRHCIPEIPWKTMQVFNFGNLYEEANSPSEAQYIKS
ncbi:UDP-N-acetyl-D-mannosaminuronic acid dehydrogenase [Pullulanibacillus pueri]|uniref:UDP-N-acetyl-D-mannosamine dehydrogenase n=1 Tax=Pullulanibacillus pueri TaxID=1437324 RepID=A0A8J3EKT6_9BACL|nr:nucleotide sugar dehydrogenase [Pullulanibacillus pueri]MBM7681900.1 UDP-N-acetyl-D-mannosaminuronic acid dehydrogenase [Pullulanibacillus pueri]GGH76524.1 UDP-N-acetyl-D-mannosamine dehydrogenase [Pullulanibacillus pueri]